MPKAIIHYSCLPGIGLVPKKDQDILRKGLMEIFGNPCKAAYYQKIKDFPNIPYDVKVKIDGLFFNIARISEFDIWKTWTD